jgi:hypothetical protein
LNEHLNNLKAVLLRSGTHHQILDFGRSILHCGYSYDPSEWNGTGHWTECGNRSTDTLVWFDEVLVLSPVCPVHKAMLEVHLKKAERKWINIDHRELE